MKMTTSIKKFDNRAHLRALLLIPFVLICFALLPQARAVCQEGCDGTNTFLGEEALFSLTTGIFNTAVGFNALESNTEGDSNTAIGGLALQTNTTGTANTAIGVLALWSNTTGFSNTAIGVGALFLNTTGTANTANGDGALATNATGSMNTANGLEAMFSNTIGNSNSANGWKALFKNTTGDSNTANGLQALFANRTGNENTANGSRALLSNTIGDNNTAIGFEALRHNQTGRNNIALGFKAGSDLSGNDNIDIGNRGVIGDSNAIRIGTVGTHKHTFIAGISGATVGEGVGVIIDADGHLGTVVSSERFKEEIKPMDKASEAILALKPVTFRYKHELDPPGMPQFGLVAEEVEKVNPDLVARDKDGKPYTVRYEAVNAMLLNEFLKEHAKVEQLKEDFEFKIAEQQKQIKALMSGLEKVSAQLELTKSATQIVVND